MISFYESFQRIFLGVLMFVASHSYLYFCLMLLLLLAVVADASLVFHHSDAVVCTDDMSYCYSFFSRFSSNFLLLFTRYSLLCIVSYRIVSYRIYTLYSMSLYFRCFPFLVASIGMQPVYTLGHESSVRIYNNVYVCCVVLCCVFTMCIAL